MCMSLYPSKHLRERVSHLLVTNSARAHHSTPSASHTPTTTIPPIVHPPPTPHLPHAAFTPGSPAASHALHAASSSTTNACPSGDDPPCTLQSYGSTTGVSHISEVKCESEDEDEDEEPLGEGAMGGGA